MTAAPEPRRTPSSLSRSVLLGYCTRHHKPLFAIVNRLVDSMTDARPVKTRYQVFYAARRRNTNAVGVFPQIVAGAATILVSDNSVCMAINRDAKRNASGGIESIEGDNLHAVKSQYITCVALQVDIMHNIDFVTVVKKCNHFGYLFPHLFCGFSAAEEFAAGATVQTVLPVRGLLPFAGGRAP